MAWLTQLNKPWLHFLLLGIVFFKLQSVILPEPKTVIGPLEGARLEALQQQWFTLTGQLPSPKQTAKLIADELDRDVLFQRALELNLHLRDSIVYDQLLRDMRFLGLAKGKTDDALFQQALAMRLHLSDEIVKRRLIQHMQQRLLIDNPPPMPSQTQIAEKFAISKQQYRRPPRYSIEHLFFNAEREAEVETVIAEIQRQRLDAKAARHLSSPFISGNKFVLQTPDQLAKYFGSGFVYELERADPVVGQWLGPIRSSYGLHYVWVTAIEPGRDARLDEVISQLRSDLEATARSQALQHAIAALRKDYEVRL